MGSKVGTTEGRAVSRGVGLQVGWGDGVSVGWNEGLVVGGVEGSLLGATVGFTVGPLDGDALGLGVGLNVGIYPEEMYMNPGKSPAMSKLPELLDAIGPQEAVGADVTTHVEP